MEQAKKEKENFEDVLTLDGIEISVLFKYTTGRDSVFKVAYVIPVNKRNKKNRIHKQKKQTINYLKKKLYAVITQFSIYQIKKEKYTNLIVPEGCNKLLIFTSLV